MAKSKDSAPKGSRGKKSIHPVKAGPHRNPHLKSYRDSAGKRHWEAASSPIKSSKVQSKGSVRSR